jgi:hypothetical protein
VMRYPNLCDVTSNVRSLAFARDDELRAAHRFCVHHKQRTLCHPEPQRRRRTSSMVMRYTNLGDVTANVRSLAFARDDGKNARDAHKF